MVEEGCSDCRGEGVKRWLTALAVAAVAAEVRVYLERWVTAVAVQRCATTKHKNKTPSRPSTQTPIQETFLLEHSIEALRYVDTASFSRNFGNEMGRHPT